MDSMNSEKRIVELETDHLTKQKLNRLLSFCMSQSDEIVLCSSGITNLNEASATMKLFQLVKVETARSTRCLEGNVMTMYHFKINATIQDCILRMEDWYAPVQLSKNALEDNQTIVLEDPAFYRKKEIICSICSKQKVGRLFLTEGQYNLFNALHIPHTCCPPYEAKNLQEWLEMCAQQEREQLMIVYSEEGTIPSTIGQLTTLKTLEILDHEVTHLPQSMQQLTHLECLRITDNQMQELGFSLEQFRSLKILDLTGIALKTLPEGLFALTELEELYLDSIEESIITEQFMALSRLKILTLPKLNKKKYTDSFIEFVEKLKVNY